MNCIAVHRGKFCILCYTNQHSVDESIDTLAQLEWSPIRISAEYPNDCIQRKRWNYRSNRKLKICSMFLTSSRHRQRFWGILRRTSTIGHFETNSSPFWHLFRLLRSHERQHWTAKWTNIGKRAFTKVHDRSQDTYTYGAIARSVWIAFGVGFDTISWSHDYIGWFQDQRFQ